MHTVILVITTLSSIATIIAAIIALIKPGMMSRSTTITHGERFYAAMYASRAMSRSTTITHGERFYAAMYASRALPLGLLTVVAPFVFHGSALQLVFAAASLAQIGDVIIGLKKQEWGMVIAPAILATIYLAAAWLLA